MDGWQIVSLVAALVFGAVVLWRVRPAFFAGAQGATLRGALAEAKARIEAAKTDGDRADALSDAGDLAIRSGEGAESAIGYYLRAMRTDPRSPRAVERAAIALARRPRALESLLWRRLGSLAWHDEGRASAEAALRHLIALYNGRLRQPMRAKALENALAALGPSPQTGGQNTVGSA